MNNSISELMNAHQSDFAENDRNAVTDLNTGENPYLSDPAMGLQLCAALISQGNKTGQIHQILDGINHLIEVRFLDHTKNDDNALAATTYAQLQQLQRHLNEIACFPHLEKFYTVAVGGSFSAGKSRFLNSVLGCPSLLPTDTTPTTSIPTYISKGNKNAINALNFYRKSTAIDEDALKAICHTFNKRYNVTFSHLLQLISVERLVFKYPKLVFLDTPGYNKADDIHNSQNNTDENLAREHLSSAYCLVWLVDIQNGTIPQPDIEFLFSLDLKQPFLVVLSKADKKPESQIKQIVDTIKRDLDRAKLEYLDVIAYSSEHDKEYSPSGRVLRDLLQELSQGKGYSLLLWQVQSLFDTYMNFHQSKKQTLDLTVQTVNELIFEESVSSDRFSHLKNLKQKSSDQISRLKMRELKTKAMANEFKVQIEAFSKELGIENTLKPDYLLLKKRREQRTKSEDEQIRTVTFNGLVQGDISSLSHLANLETVPGVIKKVSAVGVSIGIKAAPKLEIMVMQAELRNYLEPSIIRDNLVPGTEVTVHLMSSKKCTITLNISN